MRDEWIYWPFGEHPMDYAMVAPMALLLAWLTS